MLTHVYSRGWEEYRGHAEGVRGIGRILYFAELCSCGRVRASRMLGEIVPCYLSDFALIQ